MSLSVAFLRGLNVGGHRVTMDKLRSLFEDAGFGDVSTFIASGNVLFDPGRSRGRKLESKLESALKAELGYEVDTFVRTLDEISAIADSEPVAEAEELGWNLYVIFLKDPVDNALLDAFRQLETDDDLFRERKRELFWLRNGGVTDSAIHQKHLRKAFDGRTYTSRNFKTVARILKKYH